MTIVIYNGIGYWKQSNHAELFKNPNSPRGHLPSVCEVVSRKNNKTKKNDTWEIGIS